MTDAPLPCPWCGGAPDVRRDPCCGRWSVACRQCAQDGMMVQTGWKPSKEEAVVRWNRRADG